MLLLNIRHSYVLPAVPLLRVCFQCQMRSPPNNPSFLRLAPGLRYEPTSFLLPVCGYHSSCIKPEHFMWCICSNNCKLCLKPWVLPSLIIFVVWSLIIFSNHISLRIIMSSNNCAVGYDTFSFLLVYLIFLGQSLGECHILIFILVFMWSFTQGVMEAIRISMAGYPTKRSFLEFVDRFGVLAPEVLVGRYDQFCIMPFPIGQSTTGLWFDLDWCSTDEVAVCKRLLERVGLEGYQVVKMLGCQNFMFCIFSLYLLFRLLYDLTLVDW